MRKFNRIIFILFHNCCFFSFSYIKLNRTHTCQAHCEHVCHIWSFGIYFENTVATLFIGDRFSCLLTSSMLLLYLCTGLQASPSKHTSYSVRMENAVPIVTQAPGAQPLQIQPGLLTQVGTFKYRRKRTNRVWILTERVPVRNIYELWTVHIQTKPSAFLFNKPSPRVVSIDGGWKSLDVLDPAPAGSCFSWVHSGELSCALLALSLSLFRSLPLFSLSSLHLPLLSWRLRLLRSDALKGRSLSHREGLYQSLHGGAGALAANIQLLQVAE